MSTPPLPSSTPLRSTPTGEFAAAHGYTAELEPRPLSTTDAVRSGVGGRLEPSFQAEGVTLYLGDCLDVLPTLPVVDLVVTDPPYSVSVAGVGRWETRYGRTTDLDFFEGDRDWKATTEMVRQAIDLCAEKLAAHGSLYAWIGHRQFGAVVTQLEEKGWTTRFLVWSKECPVPPAPGSGWPSAAELCVYAYRSGRTWTAKSLRDVPRSNVITADAYRFGQPGKVDHPTQKPLAVIHPAVRLSSSPGQTVLDCFMGSGTTAIECIRSGRRFIGIERDPKHFATAVERIRAELAQGVLPLISSGGGAEPVGEQLDAFEHSGAQRYNSVLPKQ